MSRTLHDRPAWHCFATHEKCDTDEPFVTDDCNLGRRTVFHHIQQRDDRGSGEIDVIEAVAGFIDDLSQWHVDRYEMRYDAHPLHLR